MNNSMTNTQILLSAVMFTALCLATMSLIAAPQSIPGGDQLAAEPMPFCVIGDAESGRSQPAT